MAKLLTFLLFSGLLFFGCDQESEITSPVDSGPPKHRYKLIPLPAPLTGMQIENEHTEYKLIDGEEGGSFYADYSYQSNNGTVSQYSTLQFFEYAFSGEKNISQTFNTAGAAMVFGPSMQFQATVKYSYTIYGADLTGLDPNTLDFVYIDADGNLYPVPYESVTMDENTGKLQVVKAEIPHFSRYGFVN